ncbi:carbamoyltransferase HypF [Campylobacter sp. RM12654]|uniref:carbamoyltransferase HypF n=1 Tax=Campylobacter sp. RM12654 TaxID=2735738 RepID=UPI0030153D76|nr:carbamoyltransferase HypF [Campylobacter sp. RM12654]
MSVLIKLSGRVQGVGFRPEVCKLAKAKKLNGYILNDTLGVSLALDCDEKIAKVFIKDLKQILKKNRPLASIEKVKIIKTNETYNDFVIKKPSKDKHNLAVILPDFAPCKDCIKELNNPKLKRRFNHAFINCTNCGTRFSVISKIPYDRTNTSMSVFKMCKNCDSEYNNLNDRRFYAEPIACNDCGAKLNFDLAKAVKYLKAGKIVALKGVGGFNLLCNANDFNAVNKLRMLKNRALKPLAIMVKDIKMAKKYASFTKFEERILKSKERPILLLKSLNQSAFNIHFDFKNIGVFLPSAPIFHILFKELDFAIVATSANKSGEMIYSKKSDFKILKPDLIINHNRKIINKIDDSVGQVVANKYHHLRSARGFRPFYYEHKIKKNINILALGMEEKNEFLIYINGFCINSPYIGDLKDISVYKHFVKTLRFFVKNYKIKFDYVLCDLHPHFIHSEKITKEFEIGISKNTKIIKIYHHAAHAMSIGLRNIRAFCFDGTGYKNNHHISGGEVLDITKNTINTAFCFDEFKLVNVKNNELLAYSILKKYEIPCETNLNYDIALQNCTINTSSLGRIIDAFAFLVLGIKKNEFEAHSGMLIESFYDENIKDIYKIEFKNNKIIYKDIFATCLNESKVLACSKFINTIVYIVKFLSPNKKAILSGGVFCNKSILNLLLNDKEYKFYTPKNEAINDGCIALGQLNYFLNNMEFKD